MSTEERFWSREARAHHGTEHLTESSSPSSRLFERLTQPGRPCRGRPAAVSEFSLAFHTRKRERAQAADMNLQAIERIHELSFAKLCFPFIVATTDLVEALLMFLWCRW